MRAIIGAALILGLATPTQAQTLEEAQQIIADEMRDPESTRFRNTWIVKKYEGDFGLEMCGEFNSKNAMGGYVGYKMFYAIVVKANGITKSTIIPAEPGVFSAFVLKQCAK